MSNFVVSPGKLVSDVKVDCEGVPISVAETDDGLGSSTTDLYESAYSAGFEEGKQVGLKQAKEEITTLARNLMQMFEELRAQRKSLLREAETTIARLALAISRKVIHRELSVHPDSVEAIVRETLKYVVDKDRIVVKVHPEDLALLKSKREEISVSFDVAKLLEFEEDSRIKRGGCIIETNSGTIDARLDVQLEEIEKDLLENASGG